MCLVYFFCRMDYLKIKWVIWFKFLDVDKDNKIIFEDMQIFVKKFEEIWKLIGDKGFVDGVEFDNIKWWNDYIFCKGFGVLMMKDEFVEFFVEVY